MKVLYVTSEAVPFAASGGLADVSTALPAALRRRFVGCRVVLPLYSTIPEHLREQMHFVTSFSVPVSWRRQYCGVFEARWGNVIYYLLDNQYYFEREKLYGEFDDGERFAFFARAALELLFHIDFCPDIIHCNDWQTALVPVYLKTMYAHIPRLSGIKTVYTIHNIQYQGQYDPAIRGDVFGLAEEHESLITWDGCLNLMKGGIESADAVTTVSETYAREILDPWYGCGLDRILRERQWKLSGIINGIDTELYNPETDPVLFSNYSAAAPEGKEENKKGLLEKLGLPCRPGTPLLAMVTRLTDQKGLDLVRPILEEVLRERGDFAEGIQMVVLGSGETRYEQYFAELSTRYPEQMSFQSGFLPELARQIYAAADIFLMPSKTEPCGLAQMIALRYGAIPVVRETGGLKDTVRDSGDGQGNGFTFAEYDCGALLHAIKRALSGYRDAEGWGLLRKRAMEADNSWNASAVKYIRLYQSLLPSDGNLS